MSFTSPLFLSFLLLVFLAYIAFPERWRWLPLLLSSYIFYAHLGAPYLLFVLVAVTMICFICGIKIEQTEVIQRKRIWLWGGIAASLFFLIALRYLHTLIERIIPLFSPSPITTYSNQHHWLISIGVSFFVFQAISYLIDVYLEVLEPEQHLGHVALSIAFFPKLLQGPIERGGHILPQLRRLSLPSSDNMRAGAHLFLFGAFKKIVIADRLASFVNPVYNNPHSYDGISLLIATYLYALQLYFDFSGYTDMALGVARFFNVRLTQNFHAPYLATSIADFWRRWHISFSSWILDYIFKPLQMQLRGWRRWGNPTALLVTFVLCGVWHGAGWCFIIWGALHGFYLGLAVLTGERKRKFYKKFNLNNKSYIKVINGIITFNLVCFSWIFFRSSKTSDAFYIASHGFSGFFGSLKFLQNQSSVWIPHFFAGKSLKEVAIMALLLVFVTTVSILDQKTKSAPAERGELYFLSKFPSWATGCFYGSFCYLIAFFGISAHGFIYLQF